MSETYDEDDLLRSVTLQNARAVFLARQRADQDLIRTKEELERKTRELVESLNQLQRSEQELRDSFDNASIGLHWVGPDGIILRANNAELELLGYSAAEYVGHPITEFHADRDVIDDILRRQSRGETIRDLEARMRCKDGSIKHVLIDSSVMWEDGRFIHTRSFTRDVTSKRRSEQRIVTQDSVTRALAESDNLKDAAREVLRVIGEHHQWDIGAVWYVDHQDDVLRCTEIWCQPSTRVPEFEALCLRSTFLPGVGLPGRVWQSARAQWIPDVALDGNFPRAAAASSEGLHGGFAFPIVLSGRVLGVVEFFSLQIRSPDADLMQMMTAVGSQFGQFIERKHAELAQARLLESLKEADRRKDEFLAMLAHELRNPLAPIRNAAQVFRAKAPPIPELLWSTEVIDRQVHQMTRLIDDLLDVSRITRGTIALRRKSVDVASVVNTAVESARALIEKWGHHFTVVIPPEPIHVDADADRLAQVLLNLLNNAAKYTDHGGRISLTVEAPNGQVVIRVRDTGIGIPAEMLSRIFDMFTQVDHSLERSEGGLGLGLTLVQRLVEMHGGSVVARSEGRGKGSEFMITLPLAREVAAGRPAGAAGDAEPTPPPRRILVVDDNRDAADSLGLLLRIMGNEVQMAHDGLEAVGAAAAFRPDVVLLDIGLPKLNGYEVARRIREQEGGEKRILIAVTGWGQDDDRQRSRDSGFDHHMTKPVELAALTRLLRGERAPTEPAGTNA
ncbi:MAG TPA: ATP-binding protein [Candidatus Udaeobacter sp.]|nr:ATP-binding protein [Candidatus Udaeobacter sp.]